MSCMHLNYSWEGLQDPVTWVYRPLGYIVQIPFSAVTQAITEDLTTWVPLHSQVSQFLFRLK